MPHLQRPRPRDLHPHLIVSEGHEAHGSGMLPPGGGARTAPSAERHAAPWGEGRAPLRSVSGREVFEKGFEGEGAAADEPRVDLEDPVERKKDFVKTVGNKRADDDDDDSHEDQVVSVIP